jgi:hypothetical protein
LFFLIVAVFSAFFPLYSAHHGKRIWTRFYPAILAASVTVPLFMMGGVVRPALAAMLLILATYLGYQAIQKGKIA